MSEDRTHDVRDHTTVYRLVTRPGGEVFICEHRITDVTPTEVRISRAASNDDVPAFYQSRTGTYVLDREELENTGRAEIGTFRTRFYLRQEDAAGGPVEEQGQKSVTSLGSDESLLPVQAIRADVVDRFERITEALDRRYGEGFSARLLLETTLRQAFVDVHAHGRDSALVLQLDTLSIQGRFRQVGTREHLHPLPVERVHTEIVEHLMRLLAALDSRYAEHFSGRHVTEVALQHMFADLRMHQQDCTIIRWLDAILLTAAAP